MPMQRQLWSVNALAVELDIDRRTVAKRLDGVPPAGKRGGHPVWRLSDALAALSGGKGGKVAPPPPPGCEALQGLPAGDALALLALVEMIHAGPALVSALAADRGVPAEYGPLIHRVATGALAHAAWEIGEAFGIKADVASLVDAERIAEPDWSRFAGFDRRAAESKVAAALSA